MATAIRASKRALAEWLAAIDTRGGTRSPRTPGGARCQVVDVRPGQEVEILVDGSVYFGSGGGWWDCAYAGAGYEVVKERSERNGFCTQVYLTVRLLPGTMIYSGWGDDVGDGRSRHVVYVCREMVQ